MAIGKRVISKKIKKTAYLFAGLLFYSLQRYAIPPACGIIVSRKHVYLLYESRQISKCEANKNETEIRSMKKAFLYSLKHSIPILISFIPVGLAYGILMQTSGLNWLWTGACSLFIFAGSLQFLAVSFFAGGVSLFSVAVMAFLLNSRHIFYGIPFIDRWKQYGPWKLFLIYALPDEAFSLHCSNTFDDGSEEDRKWTYVFDALLVLLYWVILSVTGALIGSLISFNTDGIDFTLTALFIVILTEQMKTADGNVLPAVIAAVSSVICLLLFGPSGFILPSLMMTVLLLNLLRGRIEKRMPA